MTGPSLIFRRLERDTELVSAGFGTSEPGPSAEEVRPSVLLMPLAGFDGKGTRIGYGKAFTTLQLRSCNTPAPFVHRACLFRAGG